jgi:hypothetical protein
VKKVASKGLEAHQHNWEFEENESTDIGKCQRLWKEDNTRIIKVSGMRPGFARIIEKVRISRNINYMKLTFIVQRKVAEWITLTTDHQNHFIDSRKANV